MAPKGPVDAELAGVQKIFPLKDVGKSHISLKCGGMVGRENQANRPSLPDPETMVRNKTWKTRLRETLTLLHNLGMDAAIVAATWHAIVTSSVGNPLHPELTASIFFAVWTIYLGDRVWDAWRNEPSASCMERHRFARRHREVLALLVVGNFLLASIFAASAFSTARQVTWAALGLVAILCIAYYSVRMKLPDWERGRAVVVGGTFATGTLFAVPGLTGGFLGLLILTLGALFTANIRICVWAEEYAAGRTTAISLVRPCILSVLGFSLAATGGHLAVALAGFFSLAGLWYLGARRQVLPPEILSIGADAMLFLPPLLILPVALWLG